MKTIFHILIFGLILSAFGSCTPKTGEQVTQTEPTPVEPQEDPCKDPKLSSCTKFCDIPNGDDIETKYVLSRDFLKTGDWDKAFEFWKEVYAAAPAADGLRNTVFADGIRYYEHFLYDEKDPAKREEYITIIFNLYDEI